MQFQRFNIRIRVIFTYFQYTAQRVVSFDFFTLKLLLYFRVNQRQTDKTLNRQKQTNSTYDKDDVAHFTALLYTLFQIRCLNQQTQDRTACRVNTKLNQFAV